MPPKLPSVNQIRAFVAEKKIDRPELTLSGGNKEAMLKDLATKKLNTSVEDVVKQINEFAAIPPAPTREQINKDKEQREDSPPATESGISTIVQDKSKSPVTKVEQILDKAKKSQGKEGRALEAVQEVQREFESTGRDGGGFIFVPSNTRAGRRFHQFDKFSAAPRFARFSHLYD